MTMWQRSSGEAQRGSAKGTEVDWSAVLRQHDRWLRTVVYSRLREAEAVDEVMQEVALAAVRQSAPPADRSKVAPWLYRVAVRQALLYRRRLGRRRKLTDRYVERKPPAEHDAGSPDPLDWLLAEERHAMVRKALGRLPRRDAEILLLKYAEDWSYQQIAAHLGITPSAVEARLHRARRKLRAELAAGEKVD
jgi:RNA polymerase sigma-70 factor (ECF subfamily)